MRLGNLTVEQIENRIGVEFSQEVKDYMEDTRELHAENIPGDKWHCFDIPFIIVCGSENMARTLVEKLTPFADSMKTTLHIGYQ